MPNKLPELADLMKLTAEERKAYMALLKRAESPLNDPDYLKRCMEYKPVLEEQCRKKGLNLAHVFTASDKPRGRKAAEPKVEAA